MPVQPPGLAQARLSVSIGQSGGHRRSFRRSFRQPNTAHHDNTQKYNFTQPDKPPPSLGCLLPHDDKGAQGVVVGVTSVRHSSRLYKDRDISHQTHMKPTGPTTSLPNPYASPALHITDGHTDGVRQQVMCSGGMGEGGGAAVSRLRFVAVSSVQYRRCSSVTQLSTVVQSPRTIIRGPPLYETLVCTVLVRPRTSLVLASYSVNDRLTKS